MTIRRPAACEECGAVTLTRTSVGHSDYQEFAFPCPKCGIEIRFGMTINQQSPAIDYTLTRNCKWVPNETPVQFEQRFDSENLCSLRRGQMMPFIETVFLAKDVEQSRQRFARRFSAVRTGWPVIEKMLVHEANGNIELFNRALGEIKSKNTANSKVEMAGLLMAVMDIIGSDFFVDDGSTRERIMSLINTVAGKKEALGEALTHYRENGRLQSLWQDRNCSRFGGDGERCILWSHRFTGRSLGIPQKRL
jgi:hypothetical protein